MSLTAQLDICLQRVYDLKNASYLNEDGKNKFICWVDDNGYDTEALHEEFQQHYDEAAICDFDDDFPTDKTGDDRLKEIFTILKISYTDPIAFFEDEIVYQQTILFDGYIRIKIMKYCLNIPQDIVNLCKIFYKTDNLWLYGFNLRRISGKCRQSKDVFDTRPNYLQRLEQKMVTTTSTPCKIDDYCGIYMNTSEDDTLLIDLPIINMDQDFNPFEQFEFCPSRELLFKAFYVKTVMLMIQKMANNEKEKQEPLLKVNEDDNQTCFACFDYVEMDKWDEICYIQAPTDEEFIF